MEDKDTKQTDPRLISTGFSTIIIKLIYHIIPLVLCCILVGQYARFFMHNIKLLITNDTNYNVSLILVPYKRC